jgi:hypothetical protein
MPTFTKVYIIANPVYLIKPDDGSPWRCPFSITLEAGVLPYDLANVTANFVGLSAEFYNMDGEYIGNHADYRMFIEAATWDQSKSKIDAIWQSATDQNIPAFDHLEINVYARVELKLNRVARVDSVKSTLLNWYPPRIKNRKKKIKKRS